MNLRRMISIDLKVKIVYEAHSMSIKYWKFYSSNEKATHFISKSVKILKQKVQKPKIVSLE